LLLKTEEN